MIFHESSQKRFAHFAGIGYNRMRMKMAGLSREAKNFRTERFTMKHKTRAALAVSVASVMACGIFAGCDLVTTDAKKDYEQVIAEVNIANTEEFKTEYASYNFGEVIQTENVYKRDMVASFVASGSTVMGQYGWTYSDTFDAIKDSLVNRAVYVQYAKVYFLSAKNADGSAKFTDENGDPYTSAGYKAALTGDTELDKTIAGLKYFLTDEEEGRALYALRVSLNGSLDSIEESIIDAEDEEENTVTVRTTPTGVDTENEDYYDPDYRIYTGAETALGSYEKVDGSTAYTRRQAYANFLTNIRSSGLLNAGEDTTKVENLSYFKRELKSSYESAVITKMSDAFEEEAAALLTDDWLTEKLSAIYASQKDGFAASTLDIDSALDGMSDSSFVLTAPMKGYGFVVNILLPFSAQETQDLADVTMDKDDLQGNKFAARAEILKRVKATDQRGTWFTGETDYSYEGTGYQGTLGNGNDRTYLFFENSLDPEKSGEGKQYETLKNYYGKYTYNGKVTKDKDGKYTVKPKKIDIDEFIAEMEGYLKSQGIETSPIASDNRKNDSYFTRPSSDYYKDGKVDYSAFVYYAGKVNFAEPFDANKLFDATSEVNKAFSIINELSFAYNTDTAGLNSYLGYAVTPKKTDFVSEFEYAAQTVCARGAGNYIVVPSDYGWHVIYCTFSFTETDAPAFSYLPAEKDKEGTFSNLFYEAQKTAATASYSSNKQTEIINRYAEAGATIHEDRYADLSNLDNTNS